MMLVKILGFGSNWWARFGDDRNDPWRFTRHAAYYNSAGLRCGQKIRRHWLIPGLIRFNGAGAFDPHFPSRCMGKSFYCDGPTFTPNGNRLLVEGRVENDLSPDYILTVISSDRHGVVDFVDPHSRTETVLLLAVSQLGERQEAIVLMKPAAWVVSSVGFWQLAMVPGSSNGFSLQPAELADSIFV